MCVCERERESVCVYFVSFFLYFFFFNCDTDYIDPAFLQRSRTRQHLSSKRWVLTAHKNGSAVHDDSIKTNAASTVIRTVQKEGRDQKYGHLYKRKTEIRV